LPFLKLRNNILSVHIVKIKDKENRDDHEPTCQKDDPYFFVLNRICVHRASRRNHALGMGFFSSFETPFSCILFIPTAKGTQAVRT
jgi:hypothetical protein